MSWKLAWEEYEVENAAGAPLGVVVKEVTLEGYEVKRALLSGEAVEKGRVSRYGEAAEEGRIVKVGGKRYLTVGDPRSPYFAVYAERAVRRLRGKRRKLLELWGQEAGAVVKVVGEEVEAGSGERRLETYFTVLPRMFEPRAVLEVEWWEEVDRVSPMNSFIYLPPPTADTAALIEALWKRVIPALRGYYSAERVERAVDGFLEAIGKGYRKVEVEEKSYGERLWGHKFTAVVRANVDRIRW